MKPWQYHVRRVWTLFHIFYQNWTLNMAGVCKEWRLLKGCSKNRLMAVWPLGQSLSFIFHSTKCEQGVDAATVFCSLAHLLCAFWRRGCWYWRHPLKCCWDLQGCAAHSHRQWCRQRWKSSGSGDSPPSYAIGRMPAEPCASVSHSQKRTAKHFCCAV